MIRFRKSYLEPTAIQRDSIAFVQTLSTCMLYQTVVINMCAWSCMSQQECLPKFSSPFSTATMSAVEPAKLVGSSVLALCSSSIDTI